jgi:hypothetical protein
VPAASAPFLPGPGGGPRPLAASPAVIRAHAQSPCRGWPPGAPAGRALEDVEIVITNSDNTSCQQHDQGHFRWSGGELGSAAGLYEPGNRCCQRHLILDTGCSCRWSAASILNSHAATMAALVVLTGRLSGHTQPGGDLWPPDAQADSLVDQLRECRFCSPLRNPGALNLLQHLGGWHSGSRPCLAWRLRWGLLPSLRLSPPSSRARSAFCSSHEIQDAGEVRQPGLPVSYSPG